MIQSFRKKPVGIQAVQWTGAYTSDVIGWVLATGRRSARWHEALPSVEPKDDGKGCAAQPEFIAIDTLEGTMQASVGDWIVRGVQGEHYPVKPDIFLVTYEPASPEPIAAINALVDHLTEAIDPEDRVQADILNMLRVAAEAYPVADPDSADACDRLAFAVATYAQSGLAMWRQEAGEGDN